MEATLGSQGMSPGLVAQSTLICPPGGPKALPCAPGCFCLAPPPPLRLGLSSLFNFTSPENLVKLWCKQPKGMCLSSAYSLEGQSQERWKVPAQPLAPVTLTACLWGWGKGKVTSLSLSFPILKMRDRSRIQEHWHHYAKSKKLSNIHNQRRCNTWQVLI